ncbi:MAG TPA: TonB-dependent receptor [Steroidobacteraceae bacterium]|nr:TonB-dependent receptor [Steroidobacteraceae bacterium]
MRLDSGYLRLAWTISGAVAAALLSASVSAQTLEEVVVTATKREQNVQNVPIAISAFTTETLRAKAVTDIHALSNLTPNVNLDASSPFSGDTSVLSASIRGIGQDDFAFNLDPGVGVYLDGVYLARTIGANQNLLDVDRVEILKGPQGTLFGRNTIGGAINIVTHEPGTEARFQAQATGGSYSRADVGFTADLPITDTLLTTVTASSSQRDGYQRVIPYPGNTLLGSTPFIVDPPNAYPRAGYDQASSYGGQNLQVIRSKVVWHASDNFKATFTGDYQHQDQPSTPATILSVTNGDVTDPNDTHVFGDIYNLCISTPANVINTVLPPIFNTTTGLCGPRATGSPELGGTGGAPLGGAGYVSGPGGNLLLSGTPRIYWNFANTQTGNKDTTYANGVSFAKNDAWGAAMTLDWTVNDANELKSITGYRQIKWSVGIDLDGTPESIQEVTDNQNQYQFSQEFQWLGRALNDKIQYVAGLYYFKENGFVHDFVPFEGLLYVYDYQNDVDTESYAGFVHVDFKFTDTFGATLGGRYTDEKKKFIGGQADLNGFAYKITGCNPPTAVFDPLPFGPPGGIPNPAGVDCRTALGFPEASQPLRYFPADQQEQTFHEFTPEVGLQWNISPDVMTYVKYSEGFKSGGWTTRLSNPILDGSFAEFKPERAKSGELGLKSVFLDNRFLVNTAIFYTKYDDIQLNFQEGASPVLRNAGTARLQGIEVESQAVLGGGFGFTFAGGYIDAKYTDVTAIGITTDSDLPKTPEYKINVGPTYDFNLGNGGALRLAVDYTHTADMWNDSLNTANLHRPETDNLNAAIRYMSPNDTWELTLGGTNLTDDRYLVTGSINEAAGEHVGTYNAPSQWYVTVRVNLQ